MIWHVRTEEEGYRIEYVSKAKLQRQLMDTKPVANPGEQTVNCRDERQDCERIAEYLAGKYEAENGALRKSM
jgi:hypothetical protein